jgi:hypothetical protein
LTLLTAPCSVKSNGLSFASLLTSDSVPLLLPPVDVSRAIVNVVSSAPPAAPSFADRVVLAGPETS